MNILARYIHGSADSTDCDVIYLVDTAPGFQEAKDFCVGDPEENRNLAVVNNGIIEWCFKGFPDEVNNSLLATYRLHRQEDELLVKRPVERDLPLKLLSVLRKNIMELRHTTLRNEARRALKRGYSERAALLKQTDFRSLIWEVPEQEQTERKKSMAFQLAQAISLNDHLELYTKQELAEYMPSLRPYLYRQPCCADSLEAAKERFLHILSGLDFEDCSDMMVRLKGTPERYIMLKGKECDIEVDNRESFPASDKGTTIWN